MQNRSLRIASAILGILFVASTAARADFIDLWADKTDVPADKAPPRGHSKVLLIPVQIDYAGSSGTYQPIDLAALTKFFTATPSQTKFSFPGFIKIASGNHYQPEVTVAPLVHYVGCPPTLINASNPSACTIGRGDVAALTSGMNFVRDVFRITHDVNKVDFSKFDINGKLGEADGAIDGVMMVVNVPDIGIAFPISYINGGSNLSGGNGGPLILDGIKVPYVSIGGSVTFADGSQHLETTIVHEFGHQLGLADLYYEHTSGTDPYPNWQGLHFSTMGDWDYGPTNFIPDAESRRALTWQEQHVVSGTETITLQPAANGGYAVKLGMMTAAHPEYFLAEVRGPVGDYDTQIADKNGNPTWGLSVYHVDWSVGPKAAAGTFVQRLINCLNCTPWHPFISNVESGGQFGLVYSGPSDMVWDKTNGEGDEKVLFETGSLELQSIPNAGVLSATNRYSATNYYDGSESSIKIANVIVNADHSVTATFTAPANTDPCADVTCPALMQCTMSGVTAGSCEPMVLPVADGGPSLPGDAGTTTPVPADNSAGCATGGSQTSSTFFWLIPLGLALGLAARRKSGS